MLNETTANIRYFVQIINGSTLKLIARCYRCHSSTQGVGHYISIPNNPNGERAYDVRSDYRICKSSNCFYSQLAEETLDFEGVQFHLNLKFGVNM